MGGGYFGFIFGFGKALLLRSDSLSIVSSSPLSPSSAVSSSFFLSPSVSSFPSSQSIGEDNGGKDASFRVIPSFSPPSLVEEPRGAVVAAFFLLFVQLPAMAIAAAALPPRRLHRRGWAKVVLKEKRKESPSPSSALSLTLSSPSFAALPSSLPSAVVPPPPPSLSSAQSASETEREEPSVVSPFEKGLRRKTVALLVALAFGTLLWT